MNLAYTDLLAPEQALSTFENSSRIRGLSPKMNILGPNYTPVHPEVIASDQAFTQPFIQRVKESVLDSMKQDIRAIRETLGIEIKIDFTDSSFSGPSASKSFELDNIQAHYLGSDDAVDVKYGSSNMRFTRSGHLIQVDRFLGQSTRIPEDKLAAYKVESENNEELHRVWYRHNISDLGPAMFLFYRNFAIQFNNMAIEELKKE